MTTREKIRHSFLSTALWTEELDAQYGVEDFVPSAITKADQIIDDFLRKAPEDALNKYLEYHKSDQENQLGHDLWLSINGHGAGFFDHSLGGGEDVLQKVASDMRWVDKTAIINHVFVSEDLQIFIE